FRDVTFLDANGDPASSLDCTRPFSVQMTITATDDLVGSQVSIRFTSKEGTPVFTTGNGDAEKRYVDIEPGSYRYTVTVPGNLLHPGTYDVLIASYIPNVKLFDRIGD